MKAETMMKWRVRRHGKSSSNNSEVNEDVRRSLEILDNVLAEFDDHDIFSSPSDVGRDDDVLVNGDEQGSSISHAHQEKERWEDENGNKLEQNNHSPYCSPNGHVSLEARSIDGTTSQHSSLLDESRRCSAPPVPKRSPGTRLSNRDRRLFPKEEEDDEEETTEIPRVRHSLCTLHLTSQNGERARTSAVAVGKRKAALSVPTPSTSSSSSPVNHNNQISNRLRHGEITDENRCFKFYLVRDGGDDADAADDDVFFPPPQPCDVKCKTSICRVCGGSLIRSTSTSVPPGHSDTRRHSMDSAISSEAHLRKMRLDKKFAKIKVLLKTNQVTGLDRLPPSFKPPPPPRISSKSRSPPHQSASNTIDIVVTTSETLATCKKRQDFPPEKMRNRSSSELPSTKQRPCVASLKETHSFNGRERSRSERNKSDASDASADQRRSNVAKPPRGLLSRDVTCAKREQKDSAKISSHLGSESNDNSAIKTPPKGNRDDANQNLLPTDVICKNCINKGWTFRSLESLPKSPSSLKRPPLGLSYSMEDDLSPGVKEILSSPPKTMDAQGDSVLSSPKDSPVTHLSTFSHSASSLGDGSSQSDLELSTSVDSGKVPLTSIKSLTLPTDMKLGPSPFYSAMEGEQINGTDAKLGVNGLEATRSSSAPPPLQDKGHWKKDKTGFSRKEKQNKNDAVESSRQTEEEVTTDEKPKKRSVWKSILRRK